MNEPDVDWENAMAVYCDRILSTSDEPRKALWHYTGAAGCEGIVSTAHVFATHYGFTNDTTELRHGETLLRKLVERLAVDEPNARCREAYAHLLDLLPGRVLTELSDVYLACFTAGGGNQVQQWSGYGSRGAGYALCLNVQPPSRGVLPFALTAQLVEVIYRSGKFRALVERQLGRHARIYEELADAGGGEALERIGIWMLRECAALTPRYKNRCFEHEKEWRLIVAPMSGPHATDGVFFRVRGDNLIPYIKVPLGNRPLRQLVCGPAHAGEQNSRLAATRLLLTHHGYDPDLAKTSAAPFRG